MFSVRLDNFVSSEDFQFYIGYGVHDCDFDMHYHEDFYEMVTVLNGTATHIVGDETYFLRRGDIFIISGMQTHGFKNVNELVICNCMFKPEIMFDDQIFKDFSGFSDLFGPDLEKPFKRKLSLSFDVFNKMRIRIEEMINEYDNHFEGRELLLKTYFSQLAIQFLRLYRISAHSKNEETLSISKAISYIEENYTSNITIEMLSKMVNMSPRHFSRVFASIYNTTPIQYVIYLRLQKSCSLLKTTNLSIAEISEVSGFLDSNYFSRVFKNYYRISPRAFKKSF